MSSVPKRIMEIAEALPEATPICPRALLHLGSRAAVDQALSRLVRDERLDRICQGVYMRPIETRFGMRSPDLGKALSALAKLWGETIVPNGGGAANVLGLTTQVPIRPVYWTSGRNRQLQFGGLRVTLLHAAPWELLLPGRRSGLVVRALAFLSRQETHEALTSITSDLSEVDVAELLEARPLMPVWMAGAVSAVFADA